jgi:hypothetical protein
MSVNHQMWFNFTFHNPLSVALPTPLELDGYEAAVTFISVPQRFYNVPAGYVEKKVDGIKTRRTIPSGFYSGPQNLIDKINELLDEEDINLVYEPILNVAYIVTSADNKSMALSPIMAAILRLPTGHRTSAKSSSSIAFSGAEEVFYITTNFTEPQLVNNRFDRVLAAVAVGGQPVRGPSQYVPVQQKLLSHMNINITSTRLQPVKFITGSVTITIHLRKAIANNRKDGHCALH